MSYLLIAVGFLLLTASAEVLVRGAVALAERLGVPTLVVGLTVVAFGTSAPELVVSVNATLKDAPAIAIGNVVGSNIANILLILGLAGVIWPIALDDRRAFLRETGKMAAITVLFAALLMSGEMRLVHGLIMLAGLIAYVVVAYRREAETGPSPGEVDELKDFEQLRSRPWWQIIAAVLCGLAGVVWGADLLVDGATGVARAFGVPEEVIGLTLVAVGTSLPELATSMAAALRKETDVAIGNVLGSNVFNILGIMGITATIKTIPVPAQIMGFDVWVMIGAALVLFPLALPRRIGRVTGAVFLLAYAAYVAILYLGVENVL